ncbi:MAG: hypothetical protein A4E35_00823 [Methanoregula sp. PtaU1.Bin051]|nr:MAG: hypothetical protein A4E35_00823 [Methanoregula sp. PtaU1.Bin051]
MEIEFIPGLPFEQGRLNVIVAPARTFIDFFNETLNFQRFMTLYVCGNYSLVLNWIDKSMTQFDVQRAFNSYQLLTILRECSFSIVIVEHDPTLYEGGDEGDMIRFVSESMQDLAHSSLVILFAPKMDDVLSRLLGHAKRYVFCGDEKMFVPQPRPLGPPVKKRLIGEKWCGQQTLNVTYSEG